MAPAVGEGWSCHTAHEPPRGSLTLLARSPLAPLCPRAFAPAQSPQHRNTVADGGPVLLSPVCPMSREAGGSGTARCGEGLALQGLMETCPVCVCGRCSKMSFHSDTERLILAADLNFFLARLERRVNPRVAAGLVPRAPVSSNTRFRKLRFPKRGSAQARKFCKVAKAFCALQKSCSSSQRGFFHEVFLVKSASEVAWPQTASRGSAPPSSAAGARFSAPAPSP